MLTSFLSVFLMILMSVKSYTILHSSKVRQCMRHLDSNCSSRRVKALHVRVPWLQISDPVQLGGELLSIFAAQNFLAIAESSTDPTFPGFDAPIPSDFMDDPQLFAVGVHSLLFAMAWVFAALPQQFYAFRLPFGVNFDYIVDFTNEHFIAACNVAFSALLINAVLFDRSLVDITNAAKVIAVNYPFILLWRYWYGRNGQPTF